VQIVQRRLAGRPICTLCTLNKEAVVSRGHGHMQQAMISMLSRSMPVTFSGLCKRVNFKQRPALEGSARRALQSRVDDRTVMALGGGGPSDPHRYCINPALLLSWAKKEKKAKYKARVKKLMRHMEPEGFRLDAKGELIISLHSRHAHRLK